MLLTATLPLALLNFFHPTNALPSPQVSDGPLDPGPQLGSLDCNKTKSPIEKAIANETVYQFCDDHNGVNIAQGDNYSTYYDTANNTRLYFNVINQCEPNGIYLPLENCLSGFKRVVKCTADCGSDWTAGGQTNMDCMSFDLSAKAEVDPVLGDQGDGVVVTCEGLCGRK